MRLCPHCGGSLSRPPAGAHVDWDRREFVTKGKRVYPGPSEWKIFDLLAQRGGQLVTRDQIHEHLYFDDPNGGPEPQIIDLIVHRLRKSCPFVIETLNYRGFVLHGCIKPKPEIPAPNAVRHATLKQLMAGR